MNPKKMFELAFGFMSSKTFLTAVKLEVFTFIGEKKLSAEEIRAKTKIDKTCIFDFLDTLHALGLLNREGLRNDALYSNTPETNVFLDKSKPSYLGGLLEMMNDRLYPYWNELEEAIKTGKKQNEGKDGHDMSMFDFVYKDPNKLSQFMDAMTSLQLVPFQIFASKFNFKSYKTLCDVGGAAGDLCVQVALQNPHMQCITFDLPEVEKYAINCIKKYKAQDKVKVMSGDFFKDPIPNVDVIAMGNILHDWGAEKKMKLIKIAYDALPENGAFVALEGFIDDERKLNVPALLMSLNMKIETGDGFNISYADFQEMCKKVGFNRFEFLDLTDVTQAAIAYKA